MVNSRSGAAVGSTSRCWPGCAAAIDDASCSASCLSTPLPTSGITDPRVKERVQDVRDHVEQHDDDGYHDHPGERDVDVLGEDALVDEEPAHAVPAEHVLGDHRARDHA